MHTGRDDEECEVVVVVELLLGLDGCRVSRCTPNILMQNQHRDLGSWAVTVQQNGRLCVEPEVRGRQRRQRAWELATNGDGAKGC